MSMKEKVAVVISFSTEKCIENTCQRRVRRELRHINFFINRPEDDPKNVQIK